MILKKNKIGSHIGIMLSFSIFILFLLFAYTIIKPAITLKDRQNLMDNLENNLIDKFSAELTITSVKIFGDAGECAILSGFFSENEQNRKILAKSDTGEILNLRKNPNNNNLKIINNHNSFFRIYSSEEFEEILSENQEQCSSPNYEKGISKTEKNIFEKKVMLLKNIYENNYNDLKNELKIPRQNEFGFEFIYANKTNISTGEINIKQSVFIEKIPVIYITNNASIEAGVLLLKIW